MSFLQNTKLFLECVSVLLPVIVDRRLFTSDHSLLLAAVSQLNVYAYMEKHGFVICGLCL